nr:MAG TPA: LRRC37A/B like protein 1 C-terminal domain [Caudoviricetes sp.]
MATSTINLTVVCATIVILYCLAKVCNGRR